jgi:hypothetical protein
MDAPSQLQTLGLVQTGKVTKAGEISRVVEKARLAARKKKKDDEDENAKRRGRPARTKDNAPDIARQSLDNAIEALNNFAIENRPRTQLRDGLITLYERYTNCRSDTKKEQLRGAVKTLEWALGIRDEF